MRPERIPWMRSEAFDPDIFPADVLLETADEWIVFDPGFEVPSAVDHETGQYPPRYRDPDIEAGYETGLDDLS